MSGEQKIDDAVDAANEFLEGILEKGAGWFLKQVDKVKAKKGEGDAEETQPSGE